MEVTEKIANLKRRAFARFKSHSDDAQSSSDALPSFSLPLSHKKTKCLMVEVHGENQKLQHDMAVLDSSITWRNSGQVTNSFRFIDNST